MGWFWGETETENTIKEQNKLLSSKDVGCETYTFANVGKINIDGFKATGNCNVDIGNITSKTGLKCDSGVVTKMLSESIAKQATESKGAGFQFSDIKAKNKTELITELNDLIKNKCKSFTNDNISDITLKNFECSDSTKLDIGNILRDSYTQCALDTVSDLTSKSDLDQTAKATQDSSFFLMLAMIAGIVMLIIFLPVLLPMLGGTAMVGGFTSIFKNLSQNFVGQVIICVILLMFFNALCSADCYFNNWFFGGWVCKKGKEENFYKKVTIINIVLVSLIILFIAFNLMKKKKNKN